MRVMEAGSRRELQLRVNGTARHGLADSRMLLSDFLRHELGLTGTHVGCEHGVCGACTVRVAGRAVRSCLMLAAQAQGLEVETVEGLVGMTEALNPLQSAFKRHHALQCGFCTPGILMSMTELLERAQREGFDLDRRTVLDTLSGHLCRCTGYSPIVAAVLDAAARADSLETDAAK